jgi:hypothetical protein
MDQVVQTSVSEKKFMGTVLVARGDQVLLSKGYGSANLAKFFPKVMDAEIEFVKDEKGSVTQMILRQGPGEMKAARK